MVEQKLFQKSVRVQVYDNDQLIVDRVFDYYPVVIGRNPRVDICLPYDFVSNKHAAIVEDETGRIVIVDLKSANGIYFEGLQVSQAPVTIDGHVSIGTLQLKFLFQADDKTQKIDRARFAALPTPPAQFEEMTPISKTKKLGEITPPPIAITKLATADPSQPTGVFDLVSPYPFAKNLKPDSRVLESFITWKGVLYDIHQFFPGEKVSIGRDVHAGLTLPTLTRRADIAFYDGEKTQCFVPHGAHLKVKSRERIRTLEDLVKSQAVTKANGGYILKLGNEEIASFELGSEIEVHFRYAPIPYRLSKVKMLEPDEEIRRTTLVSGLIHGLLIAIALLNAPAYRGPKLNNVPEHYARLLVEPPRALIEKKIEKIPEPPKKEKPKTAEKKKPKPVIAKHIVQQRPKKVVMRPVPQIRHPINAPIKVTRAAPTPPPVVVPKPIPVNINTLGALSALNAISKTTSQIPVAININKNAGGPSSFSTAGVLGTLKTSSGRLPPGGIASVRTKGVGVGSGTGYGIQGIKGAAGSRGIAGRIVGNPKILTTSKEQGLTHDQIMSVVKKYLGKIQQCYERSLFQNPTLAGKVEYEWEITSRGGVQSVRVKASQMRGADSMNTCVFGIFRSMHFPRANNGEPTVPSLPLEFGKL